MNRDEWLSRRNSRSIGQTLRSRERMKYCSAPLLLVDEGLATAHYIVNKPACSRYFNGPERTTYFLHGMSVFSGRNQRKRLHRATKSSRKQWRKVS